MTFAEAVSWKNSYDFNIGVSGMVKKTRCVCCILKVNLRIRIGIGIRRRIGERIQHIAYTLPVGSWLRSINQQNDLFLIENSFLVTCTVRLDLWLCMTIRVLVNGINVRSSALHPFFWKLLDWAT